MKPRAVTDIDEIRKVLDIIDVPYSQPFNDDCEYVHTNTLFDKLCLGKPVADSHYTAIQYTGLIIAIVYHIGDIEHEVHIIANQLEEYTNEISHVFPNINDDICIIPKIRHAISCLMKITEVD